MTNCCVWNNPIKGCVSVTTIGAGYDASWVMQKTLFEKVTRKSLVTDPDGLEPRNVRFDPRVHVSAIPYVTMDGEELPYHIKGNGDCSHGACLDPACHDRYFRDAMEWDRSTFTCNMDKCREIHSGHMARVRDRKTQSLAMDLVVAGAIGDTTEQDRVIGLLRAVRDISLDLDLYTTPEALKAAWPDELPRIII